MKLFIPDDLPSNVSLETHLDRIAVEANVLSNMVSTFRNIIPSFVSKFKESEEMLQGFLFSNEKTDTVVMTKKQKEALERAKYLNFLSFGDTMISVPTNFKGRFNDYALTLLSVSPEMFSSVNTTLVEYNAILSSFITNKEDKISLKDHSVFFKRIQGQRERSVKELKVYFPSDTGRSKARLKDVMARFKDLEELFVNNEKLNKIHNQSVIKEINETGKKSIELLSIIIDNVKDGSIKEMSPNAVQNISQGAYEAAKLLEFAAMLYYDASVLINCINGVTDEILKD